jgi:hypothetical protein
VRIAGLLHLATHIRDGWGKPIDLATVNAAAEIGDYFAAHALAAFDDMGSDPATRDARHILAWLQRTHTHTINKRDLLRAVRGTIPSTAALDPALALLELHGYIRAAETPPRASTGRPPSPTYHVHPDLHATPGDVHTIHAQPRRTA